MKRKVIRRAYPAWMQPSGAQLMTLWVFDPANPAELTVWFQTGPRTEPVQWRFARDLLHRGLLAGAGDGDVLFVINPDDVTVWLRVRNETDTAVMTFLAPDLRTFLNHTTEQVPFDAEDYSACVDELLAELREAETA